MKMPKVLVIDDEVSILESLEMFLGEKGLHVRTAASAAEGLAVFTDFEPEVVILDIRLPDRTGFDVMARLNASSLPPKVIMITAFHDMETAITSMKKGAFDYIHKNCKNSTAPFITVDCSAVVETLLESELFGHEKGAFTGAIQTKRGKVELAANWTLFLDEIGELPLGLQGKLLGFLERREYIRVGGQYPRRSCCRILAVTHRDLKQMVLDGQFREDLFYRLNVVTLNVPPLRERREDIPELTRHFLHGVSRGMQNTTLRLQEGAMDVLMQHHWTGKRT
jgi:DNA-binding NtrC family response regulator